VTRKRWVRAVIAPGRDPLATKLGAIAERPHWTIDADVPLDDAFRFLEQQDAERVPVVDGEGNLVGVLSRGVLQRRLAEDEEPPDDPEPEPLLPAA
jgi:CBS domain-containing protein